jgi:uncharacterized DUF497 family protein
MVFEWDEAKERENFKKHGVHFRVAANVFSDSLRMERPDIDSEAENRWQTMGFFGDVLFVVYTERGEKTRIISARPAEPFERRIYYGTREIHGWRRVC